MIRVLNGEQVPKINSRLRAGPELGDPVSLVANAALSFVGSVVLGMGFVLTPDEREALVQKNPKNAERIFPYLGGEEVNTSPTQSFDRYVINFGSMSLEEAEQWPDLIAIVREKVKPEREKLPPKNAWNRDVARGWWKFRGNRPGLYAAITPLNRCLVTARVTKHLCFSFQPTNRVLNEKIYVFPVEHFTPFAVLQSRIHEKWTWLLSSTMRTDLNYSASDCFETFPFPNADPKAIIPALEDVGQRLYDFRAKLMVEREQGLTKTYNALKDPKVMDAPIVQLRRLHEEMDRKVLDAYGWGDVAVPAFCSPSPDAEAIESWNREVEVFGDVVIERLWDLNTVRSSDKV